MDSLEHLNRVKDRVKTLLDPTYNVVEAIEAGQDTPADMLIALGRGVPALTERKWCRISTNNTWYNDPTIGDYGETIDIIVTFYLPELASQLSEVEDTEIEINNLIDLVFNDVANWRRPLMPYAKASLPRASFRPFSTPAYRAFRLGWIHVSLLL